MELLAACRPADTDDKCANHLYTYTFISWIRPELKEDAKLRHFLYFIVVLLDF